MATIMMSQEKPPPHTTVITHTKRFNAVQPAARTAREAETVNGRVSQTENELAECLN